MPHHILLVEDDATSRRLMTTLLMDMGYRVTSAAGADEALRFLYSEDACDLVLSDIVMPGMSGLELATRTREARPGMPLVFVTGQVAGFDSSIDAGVFALAKPIARDSLARVIDDALGAHERSRSPYTHS